MKSTLILFSISAASIMFSCEQKNEIIPNNNTISLDAFSATKVNSIIKTTYPNANNITVGVLEAGKMYGADFNFNGEAYEATINNKGEFNSVYIINNEIVLPDGILTVLKEKYAGYKLLTATRGKDAAGNVSYKVAISIGEKLITLIFDDKNAIVSAFETAAPKVPTVEVKVKIYSVKLTDLPANIQSQLSGYEYINGSVKANADGTNKTYYISTKKDGLLYDFVFDNDGKLTSTKKYEPLPKVEFQLLTDANMPNPVKAYIAEKHNGWKLEKGYNTLKNGIISGTYVVLSKDKSIAYLDFDASGKLIKSLLNSTPVITKPIVEIPKLAVKELTVAAIPTVIKDYLDKTYSGWTFTKGTITTKNDVPDLYYLFISTASLKYHVYFDKDGKFLSAKRG